jgi:hypothetical protein
MFFWSVDDGHQNVDEILKSSATYIKRAAEREVSQEDFDLLASAFKHV